MTYGSSYADSDVEGAEYGLWNSSIQLDHTNFYDTVLTDPDNVWVVALMSPTCPHCKKFVAQWDMTKSYDYVKERRVKFAFIDATK